MVDFIKSYPGAALALGTFLLTLLGVSAGLVSWLYNRLKEKEEQITNKAIAALSESLTRLERSFSVALDELRRSLVHVSDEIIRLRTEHNLLTDDTRQYHRRHDDDPNFMINR